MRDMAVLRACFACALLGGVWATAVAAPGTSVLTATVMVNSNCSVTTEPVTFNTYDPIVANRTTALPASGGAVTVTCVKGTAPVIAFGLGVNASGSVRRMSSGSDILVYELYQPPNATPNAPCSYPATTVWGSGANAFSATAAIDTSARRYLVCGSVPGGQNPAVGTYTDTVTVTVTF